MGERNGSLGGREDAFPKWFSTTLSLSLTVLLTLEVQDIHSPRWIGYSVNAGNA